MDERASYSEIQSRLGRLRERWHRIYIAEGGCLLLSSLFGTLLVFAVIESWLHLAATIRWTMLAVLLAVAVGGLVVLVFKRLVADRSDEDLALLAERTYPEVNNGLINAVRLARDPHAPSPVLVNAAIQEVAVGIALLDLDRAVSAKRLRRYALLAGVFALLLVAFVILFPARMQNAFARIAFPGKGIPKVGRIVIKELTPGNVNLVSGETLKVTAVIEPAASGDIASAFSYAFEGGKPKSLKMQGDEHGAIFRAELRDVRVPLSYSVEIGGTESARYNVVIVEQPTVTEILRRYDFPPYTALEAKSEEDAEGTIRVPVGTAVQLKARANKPVKQAFVRREDGTDTPFMVESGGTLLTLPSAFRVLKDGTYSVYLVDELGNENTGRATHTIRALPDKPPEVSIPAPGKDSALPPGATLDLVIRGVDDYGLVSAQLTCWRESDKEKQVLKEWTGLQGKNVSLQWAWRLDPAKYKTGDVFRYQAKMWDNNAVNGPGAGTSSEYQLKVEDPGTARLQSEEKYKHWRAELQEALEQLKQLRQDSSKLLESQGEEQ